MINRAWNQSSRFRLTQWLKIILLLLRKWVMFTHCVHLKLGHRFHAQLKVCSDRDDAVNKVQLFPASFSTCTFCTCELHVNEIFIDLRLRYVLLSKTFENLGEVYIMLIMHMILTSSHQEYYIFFLSPRTGLFSVTIREKFLANNNFFCQWREVRTTK